MNTLSTAICNIVQSHVRNKNIEVLPEHSFSEISIDTLSYVEIIMTIEERFQIDIYDDIAESLLTVNQLITMTQTLIEQEQHNASLSAKKQHQHLPA